jgi:predicted naringenin-chalcone synthase
MIDWTHVMCTHLPHFMGIGVLVLFGVVIHQVASDLNISLNDAAVFMNVQTYIHIMTAVSALVSTILETIMSSHVSSLALLSPAVKITALVLLTGAYLMYMHQRPIYLLSFATFKAPDSWKVSHEEIMEIMRRQRCFTATSLDFLSKILERSGTGPSTAWPPGIVQCLQSESTPADRSMTAARQEAETIIFSIVQEALQKANCAPTDIDILIINCSLFSPTPSLCAMVLHHFRMRPDVMTYNLSGMGCSASLIAIDLAKDLLQAQTGGGMLGGRSKKALVVSTEILTPNFYHGNDRGFLIQNTLFRCGGAAMVLSNNWWDGKQAWYKLLHTVRVQGASDAAFECVYETEDGEGQRGVRLSKDIVKVAGKCMEQNLTRLGPMVLPITEQAKVVINVILRFLLKVLAKSCKANGHEKMASHVPTIKPYVPDFKRGIDHFCIHAGGRAVIDGIESNLRLETYHTEASRMALLNYGNTSSSSIWYELEYIQENLKGPHPLKKGDRVLQIAFGSGFKCTSGVWVKL